jgi:hypothetical protein
MLWSIFNPSKKGENRQIIALSADCPPLAEWFQSDILQRLEATQ